jgi:calcineurin-like phosphoesterase family protein
MITRFIGCLHFGHKSIATHRGFQDEFYHDEHLIDSWNSVVTNKKDITYILGDITMEKAFSYYQLDRLQGVKHVILGNHDRRQDVPELLKYVNTVGGAVDHKGFLLTHVPIHPNEVVFYRGNIHAHIHHVNKLEPLTVSSSYKDEDHTYINTGNKYYNVDAKLIDFKPKTIEELLKI